ncbi:cysteine-rich DPF motif domain-containing protein 1 [Cylas formicarius]|uniref:cysteine-rich DPF motif domain-containing protein 1 n=1 Tax=Cylas formicarius TaxID=197179 RepID=UPI002958D48E|nr:cysteine-rich DPF motif domain-containing protein 1 [Cylas formicarius]
MDVDMGKLESPEKGKKEEVTPKEEEEEIPQYFECHFCKLKEKYEYFGERPPFLKHYRLFEEAYVIEDPFVPPKQGEIIILGAHCVTCKHGVCKDPGCSIYFDGTYCVRCAKNYVSQFPRPLQEKLNRIIVSG